MIFNNFNELKKYVEKANKQTIKVIAKKEEKILQEEVKNQVYNDYSPKEYIRTGALYNNIQYTINGNIVSLKLANNNNWYSVYYDNPKVYVYALDTLDAGTTWGRNGTNVKEETKNRVLKEIPKVYKSTMNSLGVPIK